MRVLHLTRDLPPRNSGGLSVAVTGLIGALEPIDVRATVLSFDGWRPARAGSDEATPELHDTAHGRRVVRLHTPSALPAALDMALALPFDLLHVHDALLWDALVDLRGRSLSPVIASAHVLHRQVNRLRDICAPTLGSTGEARMLAEADCITAPSRAVGTLLTDWWPDVAPRVRLLPLGIDDSDAARDAAEAPRGAPVLGYAGRFSDIKGTDALFAALPGILAAVPDARVRIAGGIPENPKAERRWLTRWQESAPEEIRARVQFDGWLDGEALSTFYRDLSVLVSPSRFETFGQSVLEAMLHGVAVVANDVGGLPELIEDGVSGRLAAADEPAAWADIAIELLREDARARTLGAEAAERARARHAWPEAVAAWKTAYGDLLPRR